MYFFVNLILKKKEVIDPAMTVKITGILLKLIYSYYNIIINFSGLKLYILSINKFVYFHLTLFKNIISKNFHTLVKAKNRIGPHDNDIISVSVGSLLGDSYANKRYIEGTRLVFKQSIIHKDYLF